LIIYNLSPVGGERPANNSKQFRGGNGMAPGVAAQELRSKNCLEHTIAKLVRDSDFAATVVEVVSIPSRQN
jgi:hypothetical protein